MMQYTACIRIPQESMVVVLWPCWCAAAAAAVKNYGGGSGLCVCVCGTLFSLPLVIFSLRFHFFFPMQQKTTIMNSSKQKQKPIMRAAPRSGANTRSSYPTRRVPFTPPR
jgi:hypothetical protein